jgi:hypothetical protein
MKYALLALAAASFLASCKSSQPMGQSAPPMVDMGVRSGK